MKVLQLHIEEIHENGESYFRLTIQAGAVKIQGRLENRSLIYLMQGVPATLRNVAAEGWVNVANSKMRCQVDTDSFNFREVAK